MKNNERPEHKEKIRVKLKGSEDWQEGIYNAYGEHVSIYNRYKDIETHPEWYKVEEWERVNS